MISCTLSSVRFARVPPSTAGSGHWHPGTDALASSLTTQGLTRTVLAGTSDID